MTAHYCGEWNHHPGVFSIFFVCGAIAHFTIQTSTYFEEDARETSMWVCAECFDRMIARGSVREV